MKVKLLKKIRKQYSIVYYPHTGWYKIVFGDSKHFDMTALRADEIITKEDRIKDGGYNKSKTLQGAKDKMMNYVRLEYSKYTRKYKLSKINYKVWHNA